MKVDTKWLLLSAFGLGCVASQVLHVPPARADSPAALSQGKWAYSCFYDSTGLEGLTAKLNEAGAQGWQLATVTVGNPSTYCLKRPAP